MKLQRLRLVNFRQHADTEIAFGDGITGIIGPNGSGKTSLLEAIAWAIYGNPAARGDKDSIRNLRAKARAPVRVELEFALGNHAFRVERGLNNAELYQDGAVVANSLKEVTSRLQRVLGMTHDEFFNTYFTGQKELAVLADATRPERAAFLSRVLRHEQLTLAQERIRERRNALGHEVDGLETGLPPQSEIEKEKKSAEGRLTEARKAATQSTNERAKAQQALAEEEPRWQQWVERRDRTLSLHGDLRVAEQGVVVARQEFQRLDKELAAALAAREELRSLDAEVAPISKLKAELAELDRLHREDAARREEQAKLTELTRNLNVLDRRIAELAEVDADLARVSKEAGGLAARLDAAEQAAEEQQSIWVREKESAGTRRAALLKQHEEVKTHRDEIARLGPEGQCPTCRRPLGSEYPAVLAELDEQLELIVVDGKWLKQRIEQLANPPAAVTQAEAARDALREEVRQVTERETTLREQARECARLKKERAGLAKRMQEIEKHVAARDAGYNVERHNEVRAELARLEPVALQAATLAARADRAEALVGEAEIAEKALSAREESARQLADAVKAQGFSEPKFQAARERHDRAAHALRAAELAVAETRGELVAAETAVREGERRATERAARERTIGERKVELRLHNELDRAFSDLRAELNAAMRPEIGALASGFLSDLTDARYDEVDLDEDYRVVVLDEGVPKPVISGGEEDIANLVLRLAISQMIAERAGQPLSLLVLDEIFGSLDEARRQHVLALLRRLGDRFPQVILITHIEQVRDGLDRIIRVAYDATTGTSIVRDETATLGPTAPDESVAA
ncbi:MAG TPA: SMC family ATPase [Gemmatimonadales bacterium]|nr:SMC family ATPase [Gemmatimonadales bacterium]